MPELSTQASYDRVAAEYARRFNDELDHKPFDRDLLARFALRVKGRGRGCDLGCGPGQIAHYLHQQGVEMIGLDLSHHMVAQAQTLYPKIAFQQGDMRALPFASQALAGITAFYSIIHLPRPQITSALREWWRVLQPGGVVLIAYHLGNQIVHLDEWWGEQVSLDFTFFTGDEMIGYLGASGFIIEQSFERPPYPSEHPSQRGYILAQRSQG